MARLFYVYLGTSDITDEGLVHLLKAYWPKLRLLYAGQSFNNLDSNKIGNKGM